MKSDGKTSNERNAVSNENNRPSDDEMEAYRLWLKQAAFVDVSYLLMREDDED